MLNSNLKKMKRPRLLRLPEMKERRRKIRMPSQPLQSCTQSGSEKGVFWKRGLFRKVHLLEILENLENPQTVENKGESDHFLEILENLEILEILEIPPVKRPVS